MKTKKEIPAAGFCVLRADLLKKGEAAVVDGSKCDWSYAMPYRWLKEDEGFEIFIHGRFREAESIDFDFLSDEKDILLNTFRDYNYSDAIEEIKQWSAKELKTLLKCCGYKTYTKDIMIKMVQDLARIHCWKITLENQNPFLVK